MDNNGQINPQELQIQGLLDCYLQINSLNQGFDDDSVHLDEDTLTAFIEGNLLDQEIKPTISHLSSCSYCRHISAELVKLDMAFAEDTDPLVERLGEPTRVSDVLNGVLSKIFGPADGAVFAHNESKEETEKTEEQETDQETRE